MICSRDSGIISCYLPCGGLSSWMCRATGRGGGYCAGDFYHRLGE